MIVKGKIKILYQTILRLRGIMTSLNMKITVVNPFVPQARFLYPLKTSGNRKVFCFQGVEKEYIVNKWVKLKCANENKLHVINKHFKNKVSVPLMKQYFTELLYTHEKQFQLDKNKPC